MPSFPPPLHSSRWQCAWQHGVAHHPHTFSTEPHAIWCMVNYYTASSPFIQSQGQLYCNARCLQYKTDCAESQCIGRQGTTALHWHNKQMNSSLCQCRLKMCSGMSEIMWKPHNKLEKRSKARQLNWDASLMNSKNNTYQRCVATEWFLKDQQGQWRICNSINHIIWHYVVFCILRTKNEQG